MAEFERFDVTGLSHKQIAEVHAFIERLKSPVARCVGRDDNLESEFQKILKRDAEKPTTGPLSFPDYKPE